MWRSVPIAGLRASTVSLGKIQVIAVVWKSLRYLSWRVMLLRNTGPMAIRRMVWRRLGWRPANWSGGLRKLLL